MVFFQRNSRGLKVYSRSMGFTLMEVLVTVVILSIGLLGVAGLQMSSLRGNQTAMEASLAVSLLMEGADRVRANRPGVRNPNTGRATGDAYDYISAPGTDPGCISSGCSVAQIAQTDAFQWVSKIQQQLPSGVGVICRDSTPSDGLGGSDTVAWNDECDIDRTADIFAVKVAWDHYRDSTTPFLVYRMSLVP